MQNKRIVIFGDSIAWGAWDTEKQGWANRLKASLEKPENFVQIYNRAVSGENTNSLLNHLESDCQSLWPDIIIIAIGINDSYYVNSQNNPRIDLESFKNNLAEIQNISQKFTSEIIYLGISKVDESITAPFEWDTSKFYDNKKIQEYDQLIQDLAQEHQAKYINIYPLLNPDDLIDGLHPNSQGHQKIYEHIKQFLSQ